MNERYEFSLYPYWMMVAHIFRVVFTLSFIGIIVLFVGSYFMFRFYGENIDGAEMARIPLLLCAIGGLAFIARVVEDRLKEKGVTGLKKELIFEKDYFIYKGKEGIAQTVYWHEVKGLGLGVMKMGYKFTVECEILKFSLFSYETDPLPIGFKEQLMQANEELKSFQEIRRQYREKVFDRGEYRRRHKEQTVRNMRERSEKFFQILSQFKEKAVNAEIKKDFMAASLFKDGSLF